MRHGKAGFKLGRVTSHRWALFRNLLVALFRHERIMTTEAKAKAVRGLADHMVTLAKREDLHARRQVLSMVPDAEVVKKLFDSIAARFSERHGGYTRIMKAGLRPGDRAQMVVLELVGLLLYLIGFGLMGWALLTLGSFYQLGGSAPRPQDRMVTQGPYRLVRHPMYSAALFISLGLSLLIQSVAFFAVFVIYLVLILQLIPAEEGKLEKAYGADYTQYERKTSRLVPFIY